MFFRFHAALGAALVTTLAVSTAAQAGTTTSYTNELLYTWNCTLMPDLDQVRASASSIPGLPNNGVAYCAPTAVTNMMMYIANHGFPQVSPGPASWQAPSNYNAATAALLAMGTAMGTDPAKGSIGSGILAGIHGSLDASEKFVVQVYYSDGKYSATFAAMSKVAMSRNLVALSWGWYDITGTSRGVNIVNRLGGHCVTMTRAVSNGFASKTLWCRDPAQGSNGTAYDQSTFANRKFTANDIFVIVQPSNSLRLMNALDFNPTSDKLLLVDGYVGIRPKLGYSLTNNDAYLELQLLQPYPLLDSGTPSVSSIPLPAGMGVLDSVIGPDLSDFYLLTLGPAPLGVPTLQKLDMVSGELTSIVALPGATRLVFGRKRELYVLEGGVAQCLDLAQTDPIVATTNLAGVCDAIVFDDHDDQVVFLDSVAHKLIRYPEKLLGAPRMVDVPSSVPLSAPAAMAIRPSDGSVFVASQASSAVYGLTESPSGIVQVDAIQVPGVPAATDIDFDDAGHLFIAGAGKVYETMNGSAGWQLTINQDWAGFSIGSRFKVTHSRTNFDPATMSGPEWDNLPADQVLAIETAPSIPDCGVESVSQQYGSGKAGSLGMPQLRAPSPPWLGQSLSIELSNALPNALAVLLIGVAPLSAPFDGGTLLVNPLLTFSLPVPATGSFMMEFPLPIDPSLCGVTVYEQVLVLDPGAAGYYHVAMTNGVVQTIGD